MTSDLIVTTKVVFLALTGFLETSEALRMSIAEPGAALRTIFGIMDLMFTLFGLMGDRVAISHVKRLTR